MNIHDGNSENEVVQMAFTSVFLILVASGGWVGYLLGSKANRRWGKSNQPLNGLKIISASLGSFFGLMILLLVILLTA